MNHKWGKKLKDIHTGLNCQECSVCGCKKYSQGNFTVYGRSGINFIKTPSCINEIEESKKTID